MSRFPGWTSRYLAQSRNFKGTRSPTCDGTSNAPHSLLIPSPGCAALCVIFTPCHGMCWAPLSCGRSVAGCSVGQGVVARLGTTLEREGGLSCGACRCRRGKQLSSRLPVLAFQSAFGASKTIKHQQGALAAQLPDGPGPITRLRPPITEPHAPRITCLL